MVGSAHSLGLVHLRMASLLCTPPMGSCSPLPSLGLGCFTHGTGNGRPGSQVDIGTGAGCPG